MRRKYLVELGDPEQPLAMCVCVLLIGEEGMKGTAEFGNGGPGRSTNCRPLRLHKDPLSDDGRVCKTPWGRVTGKKGNIIKTRITRNWRGHLCPFPLGKPQRRIILGELSFNIDYHTLWPFVTSRGKKRGERTGRVAEMLAICLPPREQKHCQDEIS